MVHTPPPALFCADGTGDGRPLRRMWGVPPATRGMLVEITPAIVAVPALSASVGSAPIARARAPHNRSHSLASHARSQHRPSPAECGPRHDPPRTYARGVPRTAAPVPFGG